MRVVIASRIFSPEPSAASFILEAFAEGFRDAGHEVTVVTVRPPAGMPVRDPEGVRVRRAPVLRDATGYVRGYLQYMSFDIPLFFRLLFGRRADLYLVEPPPTTGAVVRVAAALRRRPYFYDAADIWSDAARMATSSSLVLAALRRIEVFAMRGATRAFTISAGVATRMRELGIHTPATVIAFGADIDVFRYVDAPPPTAPLFVYAGTYSEWHGAEIFLDAFARFAADHPGARLLIVGNGSEREALERKRDAMGVPGIAFEDPVDGERLNAILAGATASLASLRPGHGYDYAFTTKVYSSIAAGCPVIFSGVGPTAGFLDAAEHGAGVAVPYEVGAVADAMRAAADDPAPAAARRALSDWARERFSLRAIADTVVAEATADARGRA